MKKELETKLTKIETDFNKHLVKSLIEKYTAWAKYSDKYNAKEILTEIIADLKMI